MYNVGNKRGKHRVDVNVTGDHVERDRVAVQHI